VSYSYHVRTLVKSLHSEMANVGYVDSAIYGDGNGWEWERIKQLLLISNSHSQFQLLTSDLQQHPFQEPGTRLQLPGYPDPVTSSK